MSQELTQTQETKQSQVMLSSMQVALAGLIELPLGDFVERVKNEMDENAALEETDEENPIEETASDESEEEGETFADSELSLAMGDYGSEDEIPSYLQDRVDANRETHEMVATSTSSFYEELIKQIGEHQLNEHEKEIMIYLIGSLDEDGLLRKDLLSISDELAFRNNIMTDEKELSRLLSVLQTFEPCGIGARSLQECLQLQLRNPEHRSPWRKLALQVIDHHFKDFTDRKWDVIQERLKVDDETMMHVVHELRHLNPHPGMAFNENETMAAPTVIPDYFVTVNSDGSVNIRLNNDNVPDLCVSRSFIDTVKEYGEHKDKLSREQNDIYIYTKKKVEDAQNFINLIKRRHQTMLAVMRGIVNQQRAFFDDDDETLLKPLRLKEVADDAGVNISTVSRAANSKYVQTVHAVYPLSFFFSSSIKDKNGKEISNYQVKLALQEIVDAEDKKNPLSDDAIVEKLKERNFSVARRTVVKYRSQLNIPSTKYRKE